LREGSGESAEGVPRVLLNQDPTPQSRFLPPNPRVSSGPLFTPDGKSLIYNIRTNGADNLWLQPLDNSPGHAVTNFPSEQFTAFHFSPDAKYLAMLRQHTDSDVVLLRDSPPPQ
jgi:Tol biopolymer transport system component